jgi:hypothetical protein
VNPATPTACVVAGKAAGTPTVKQLADTGTRLAGVDEWQAERRRDEHRASARRHYNGSAVGESRWARSRRCAT